MIINTRNKSYASKGKYDHPHTSSSPSSSSQAAIVQATKTPDNQGVPSPLPSSKYNVLNQLDNIKADATLLNMVVIPEQQKNLKIFMEGKTSTIAFISRFASPYAILHKRPIFISLCRLEVPFCKSQS
jgi:hypothetical protein